MIKIITGFTSEEKFSIPDEEAHKAYYLFLNPEKRGVFSTGLALMGKFIQRIEPDYQGTMGWNPTHELNDDDWNEIHKHKIGRKLKNILAEAKRIALLASQNPLLLEQPLKTNEIRENPQIEKRTGIKSVSDIIKNDLPS